MKKLLVLGLFAFILSGACTLASNVPADNTPSDFVVIMSTPTNGAIVSTNFTARGSAYHNTAIQDSAVCYTPLAGGVTNNVLVSQSGSPLSTIYGNISLTPGVDYFIWFLVTDVEGVISRSAPHHVSVISAQTNYQDITAPQILITTPTNNQGVGENLTIAGTVSDDYSGVQAVYVALNSGSFSSASIAGANWSKGLSLSQSGVNTLKVYAVDMAGNVSATNSITVNLDNSLPSVNITSPVSGVLVNHAGITVNGNASVNNSSIQSVSVSLNGGAYTLASGTGTWSLNSLTLSQGTNKLQARAIALNNKTNTSASVTVVLDSLLPGITINSPQGGATLYTSNVTISGSASDLGSGLLSIMVSVDGGSYSSASGTGTWSVNKTLAIGNHMIKAYALDHALNSSVTSSVSFLVTNSNHSVTPPICGASPAGGDFYTASVSVTFSLSGDSIMAARYTINGSDPAVSGIPFSNGQTLSLGSGLSAGQSVTLKVFATNAGGSSAHSYTYTKKEGDIKPYITNPTLGKAVSSGTIQIDGVKGANEWTDDMIIAIDFANDDPRSLGDNWCMHETPWDLSHLYAAWDNDNLYLGWQYVDTTDIYDPSNAGSSAGTKVFQMNLIQLLIIDTIKNQGATLDMWGKNGGLPYFGGVDLPDYQIYVAGNLWQGYISKAVSNVFVVNDTDPTYYQKFMQNPPQSSTVGTSVGTTGIQMAWINTCVPAKLWGVWDADNAIADPIDPADVMDFNTMGHDKSRDTFYEMKIPLSALGITRAYLEANGIGVKLGQGEYSCLDTIPNDPATYDTPGTTDSNSPKEWEDEDLLTTPFARIGHAK